MEVNKNEELVKLLCSIINHTTEEGPVADQETLKYFRIGFVRKAVIEALPKLAPKYRIMAEEWINSNVVDLK